MSAPELTAEAHNMLMVVLNAGHAQCRCCHMISHELEPMNHTKGCVVHELSTALATKDAEIERLRLATAQTEQETQWMKAGVYGMCSTQENQAQAIRQQHPPASTEGGKDK